MSGYFRVGTVVDTLFHYVWADNPQHAVRKVENHFDMALPPQQTRVSPIRPDQVPEGDDVIDEPELEKEARVDLYG